MLEPDSWKVSNVMLRSLDSSGHILNRATHSEQVLWDNAAGHSLECRLEKRKISNGMRGNQNERLFGKESNRYVLWTKLCSLP